MDEFGLAIETSGTFGGAAIGRGDEVLAVARFRAPRNHAREFLPCVDQAAREAGIGPSQIRVVYVSIGPGSFTGLRIGLAGARMLALANHTAVVGVGSLQVVAQNAFLADPVPDRVVVMLDAKRNHVYAGGFALVDGVYETRDEAVEADPAALLSGQGTIAVLGEGLLVSAHRAAAESAGVRILEEKLFLPRPEIVYRLGRRRYLRGERDEPRTLVPLYIRPPEAEERWEKRHGAAAC